MRWGLIPHWSKDEADGSRCFNARAETVSKVNSFKRPWAKGQRCLVVTDGFYEWDKKRNPKAKQPYATRTNDKLTVFAGLWEEWILPLGERIKSCTVITMTPNELIEPLHDRMPVILAEDDWPAWLGEVPATEDQLKALLKPFPADRMKLWRVSKDVGNWRNDGPHLVDAIEPLL